MVDLLQKIKDSIAQGLQFDSRDEVEKLIKKNRLNEALIVLNRDLRANPKNTFLLSLKADLFFDLERIVEASIAYEKVLKIKPKSKDDLANLGNCLY